MPGQTVVIVLLSQLLPPGIKARWQTRIQQHAGRCVSVGLGGGGEVGGGGGGVRDLRSCGALWNKGHAPPSRLAPLCMRAATAKAV